MEPLEVAKRINLKIIELEELKQSLPALARTKSSTMVAYEKALAVAMARQDFPTTILEKIARGTCADLKGQMDLAESAYKNCLKIIDITQAQLNGYQSINRYLSEV